MVADNYDGMTADQLRAELRRVTARMRQFEGANSMLGKANAQRDETIADLQEALASERRKRRETQRALDDAVQKLAAVQLVTEEPATVNDGARSYCFGWNDLRSAVRNELGVAG